MLERRLRAEISDLPDGNYSAEMSVEDDGVSADPFSVRVAVVVRGDEVIADFTGSSPQVRGTMNCTFVVALDRDQAILRAGSGEGCAYYCGPGAAIGELKLTRAPAATPATDLAGDPLC